MQISTSSRGRTFEGHRIARETLVSWIRGVHARLKVLWVQPAATWPRQMDYLELAEFVCHRGGVVNYQALMAMEAVIIESALRGQATMTEQDCADVLSDKVWRRVLAEKVGRQAVRTIHFLLQRVRFDAECRYSCNGVNFGLRQFIRRDRA